MTSLLQQLTETSNKQHYTNRPNDVDQSNQPSDGEMLNMIKSTESNITPSSWLRYLKKWVKLSRERLQSDKEIIKIIGTDLYNIDAYDPKKHRQLGRTIARYQFDNLNPRERKPFEYSIDDIKQIREQGLNFWYNNKKRLQIQEDIDDDQLSLINKISRNLEETKFLRSFVTFLEEMNLGKYRNVEQSPKQLYDSLMSKFSIPMKRKRQLYKAAESILYNNKMVDPNVVNENTINAKYKLLHYATNQIKKLTEQNVAVDKQKQQRLLYRRQEIFYNDAKQFIKQSKTKHPQTFNYIIKNWLRHNFPESAKNEKTLNNCTNYIIKNIHNKNLNKFIIFYKNGESNAEYREFNKTLFVDLIPTSYKPT